MKHMLLSLASAALLSLAQPAMAADCYADYKAKQDSPLRLHYGVMQVGGPCTKTAARSELAARLNQNGWTLLNVLSVFDASKLEGKKANAGQYFLRF